jgi:nitroimidazol reductase NimA-like FMN-containing flavoprotein (pyridoxamine 5'-phosphate oxidase superfamily)
MTHDEATGTETLDPTTCWELLRDAPVGRLAVLVDGRPDIFPVNAVVDHGTIVFRTAPGTKLAAASRADVAYEADGYDVQDGAAWSVVVKGRGHVVREANEWLNAAALPIFPWQEGRKSWFVRIEPLSVTGRRFRVSGGARSTLPQN